MQILPHVRGAAQPAARGIGAAFPAGSASGDPRSFVVPFIAAPGLERYAEQHGIGRVFASSTGFDLPSGDTLEPDGSLVTTARWNATPPPVFGQFLKVVPDLVVEILSPSTRRRDLTEKKDVYARNGIDEYWVIDPRARSMTIFFRNGDSFDAGTTLVSGAIPSRVLPGLDTTVEQLLDY